MFKKIKQNFSGILIAYNRLLSQKNHIFLTWCRTQILFRKVVGLANYYSRTWSYGSISRIDSSYTDRVRYNSARISSFLKFSIFCKFVFVSMPGFTAFVFVFVLKCRSRRWLKSFPTVWSPSSAMRCLMGREDGGQKTRSITSSEAVSLPSPAADMAIHSAVRTHSCCLLHAYSGGSRRAWPTAACNCYKICCERLESFSFRLS